MLEEFDNLAPIICSSPNLDFFTDRTDQPFSFGTASPTKAKTDGDPWEIPLFEDGFIGFPSIEPHLCLKKASGPVVLRPFESCLSVELAVKTLRTACSVGKA
jgi:hypothetical protein